MAWLFFAALFYLFPRILAVSDCDLGATDLIFLIKASHLMSRDDFQNVKQLMKSFSETLDIGRDNTTTHVGVVLFDNIGPPQTKIPLTAYGRLSDLQMAVDNLSQLPCGADWCKEKETTFRPALDYAMSRFPKGRMKKIVLIHSGREESSVAGDIAELTGKDPWLRVLHIFIRGNIVTTSDKDATYLTGYHDPYKRYVKRMNQLYPNISIPIPDPPSPARVPKAVEQGMITVGGSDNLLKLNEEICQQLFSCPPCARTTGGRDPFDKETPLHNQLPANWKPQTTPSTKKMNSGTVEDYEYEITGDPPGLTINNNPAKNVKNREAAVTSTESVDYVYEDSVPTSQGLKKRSKRAVMSPRQRDCTCSPPLSFSRDSTGEENVKQQPAEGCTGGTNTVDAGGCGRVPSAAPAQGYAVAQPYYQQYYYTPAMQYSQYQPYYQQYMQQPQQQAFMSPCRVGNPCQRSWYYPPSPCARSPCASAAQYPSYSQVPSYQYGYYYPAQPQAAPESYATAAPILPNLESIHDSAPEKAKTQVRPAELKSSAETIFEKLAKYEKDIEQDTRPMDPFNARAFGGSQLKRIPSEGALENIVTPSPPEIDLILGKFPAPLEEESEAMIPPRPPSLKPADIGSQLSAIDARKKLKKRKRQRRSLSWGSHPWHHHPWHSWSHSASGFSHPWHTHPHHQLAARAHAAPLYSPSIPLTTTVLPSLTTEEEEFGPCEIRGLDMAVYIDDVGEMSPSEFNTAKIYLRQLWKMANKDPNTCQEMSRMAVLKTSKTGEVIVQAELNDSPTLMSKDVLLDYMEYTGCVTGRFSCEQSLPRALIMATNLLSIQASDREKLVIVISSRPSASLQRQFESLIEARDYLAQNKATLVLVALREVSGNIIGLTSSLHTFLEDICVQVPSKEKLQKKRKFCPWMSIPGIERANNSTYQIYG